jgi:hypothetical protein
MTASLCGYAWETKPRDCRLPSLESAYIRPHRCKRADGHINAEGDHECRCGALLPRGKVRAAR